MQSSREEGDTVGNLDVALQFSHVEFVRCVCIYNLYLPNLLTRFS